MDQATCLEEQPMSNPLTLAIPMNSRHQAVEEDDALPPSPRDMWRPQQETANDIFVRPRTTLVHSHTSCVGGCHEETDRSVSPGVSGVAPCKLRSREGHLSKDLSSACTESLPFANSGHPLVAKSALDDSDVHESVWLLLAASATQPPSPFDAGVADAFGEDDGAA